MENKTSPFRLLDFLVEESHIIRKPSDASIEIKSEIEPSGIILKNKKLFQLSLEVKVLEKNESFEAFVKAIGIFSFKNTESKETLNNYFFVNAPAILFPYVRAYISSLTALSGLPAINIPVISLSHKMPKLKENTVEQEE